MLRKLLFGALMLLVSTSVFAQSQAMNGLIEGVVKDSTGGVLPGVNVTVTNTTTGETKTYVTDANGNYRAPLLSLGSYKVRVELSGFKAYERAGFSLSAGQNVVVNATLETGVMTETVTVTGEAPVANPGKVDIGRTISEDEIKNLPLVSRNPYNFAFLQPNVTGYENNEFGAARINGNGSQMHTSYQIDGNTNTQKDRAGLRLLPVSEIVVKEVRVQTSGFAPEFGQTTGMVYNAITPSGSNQLSGTASFRLRRKDFSETPFYFTGTQKPDTHVNNSTFTLGGPLRKDRTHFYVGYEYVDRDLSADRVIAQSVKDNYAAVGLGADAIGEGVIPAVQKVHFAIAKIDHQFNQSHKLSVREFWFKNDSPYNIGGGANTIQRATDFNDKMNSVSAQLISQFGGNKVNELRVQYATRNQSRTASDGSVTGVAINITGAQAINFGNPLDGTQSAGFDFTTKIFQVVNNFSWTAGKHSFKAGVDLQAIDDSRVNTLRAQYTFTSVAAYNAARSGASPRGYSSFTQDLGDPTVAYKTKFIGLFVQDDVWVTPRFKLLYGARYDLFDVPDSRPFAGNPLSAEFKDDKNNFGLRAGFSWSLDAENKTVLRASSGLMYEPPLLNLYEDAILRNGDPKSYTFTGTPTTAGAPAFPATITAGPGAPKQGLVAISPDYKTQWAVLSNIQLERALTDDIAMSIGYINSIGGNMPVLIDTNLTATANRLADGRPIYSSVRPNSAFNAIDVVQSSGEGTYNALTITMNKRMRNGWQMQANYTIAKSEDNGPLPGYVLASGDDRVSDPSDLDRDKGVAPFNQTHTFALSTLLAPKVSGDGFGAKLLNNNQLGLILQANSGLPFNIRTNRDLNGDGNAANDRPLGIGRNTGRLGSSVTLDGRYVRFFNFGKRRLEIFGEGKNLLNRLSVSTVNRVVATDAAGNPTVTIPSTITQCGSPAVPPCATAAYDQRSLQIGAKITF